MYYLGLMLGAMVPLTIVSLLSQYVLKRFGVSGNRQIVFAGMISWVIAALLFSLGRSNSSPGNPAELFFTNLIVLAIPQGLVMWGMFWRMKSSVPTAGEPLSAPGMRPTGASAKGNGQSETSSAEAKSSADEAYQPLAVDDMALHAVSSALSGSEPPPDRGTSRTPQQMASAGGGVSGFVVNYWRGRVPLVISYWAVGIASNLLIIVSAAVIAMLFTTRQGYEPTSIFLFYSAFFVVSTIIFVWYAVGLWRSAQAYETQKIRSGKSAFWGGMARVVVILSVLQFVAQLATNSWPQVHESFKMAFLGDPDIPENALRVVRGGTQLDVTGGIKYGLAADVERLLDATPDIEVVHLTSLGGRIGEAQKLFDLIRARRLDTYVPRYCVSACTLVFAAGGSRTLMAGAQLGFHSLAFAGLTPEDIAVANEGYAATIQTAGVDPRFLQRAVSVAPDSIWYPTVGELTSSGIVTRVDDGSTYSMSGFGTRPTSEDISPFLGTDQIFSALEEVRPDVSSQVHQRFADGYEAGETLAQVVGELRVLSNTAVVEAFTLSTNELLQELSVLVADQISALLEINSEACFRYAVGDNSPAILGLIPESLLIREGELSARALRAASSLPVGQGSSLAPPWDKVFAQLQQRLSPSALALFTGDYTAVRPEEYATYCAASIEMYGIVAKMPAPEAGAIMRAFYTGE